jgi:RNA polymerase sigma-70 factor (ECF subfamily)
MPCAVDKKLHPSLKRFFEETYSSHLRKVQFYAYNYLLDHTEAKSVAQDVFLTLWENLENIDTQRDILPYLIVIAKFKCMKVLRRKEYHRKWCDSSGAKKTRHTLSYEALHDFTSTYLYHDEIMELVGKSLEQMPAPVKDTFILSREKNMKNSEIALTQMISIKTVEYRINCALKILRKNLRDYSV